jgi:hypothetical protein
MLLLKLAVAPLLIGLVSLAERKWGGVVSGVLVGLPLTSGPVLFFLTVEQGAAFSAHTAVGSLFGLIAQAGFALTYFWIARSHSWVHSIAGAAAAYAAISVLLAQSSPRNAAVVFLITCGVLAVALRAFPRTTPRATDVSGPELIVRMATAGGLVFLFTAIAPLVGALSSGLLAAFPVYTGVVTVFNHVKSSAQATAALRGVLVGAFSAAVFFVTVSLSLGRMAVGPCFLLAALAGIVVQILILPYVRSGGVMPP